MNLHRPRRPWRDSVAVDRRPRCTVVMGPKNSSLKIFFNEAVFNLANCCNTAIPINTMYYIMFYDFFVIMYSPFAAGFHVMFRSAAFLRFLVGNRVCCRSLLSPSKRSTWWRNGTKPRGGGNFATEWPRSLGWKRVLLERHVVCIHFWSWCSIRYATHLDFSPKPFQATTSMAKI